MNSRQNCTVTFDNDMGHYMPAYKWSPEITDPIKRSKLEGNIYQAVWESIKNDIKIVKKYSYGGYGIFYEPLVKTKQIKVDNVNIQVVLL